MCSHSLSDRDTDTGSVRVCRRNRLRICTADTSAWYNAATDLPALLPTSQGRGGALSAPAAAEAPANLRSAWEPDAGFDIV